MTKKGRFITYWASEDRIGALEEQVGQAETEADILREFVEEAAILLRAATFPEQGDYFDAQHLLADIDLHFEPERGTLGETNLGG